MYTAARTGAESAAPMKRTMHWQIDTIRERQPSAEPSPEGGKSGGVTWHDEVASFSSPSPADPRAASVSTKTSTPALATEVRYMRCMAALCAYSHGTATL